MTRGSHGRLRAMPGRPLLCALVAGLCALAWSLLTPPFHVPDENAHFAYVQYLALSGELPELGDDPLFSDQEEQTLGALNFYLTVGQRRNRPIWLDPQQHQFDRIESSLRSDEDRLGQGTASSATYNSPLYYSMMLVPYALTPSVDTIDKLPLMRLVSVLMAALTTLLVFLFLRETLPGTPWAWTVGALAVAFQPLFGFLAGGVNNDNLLILAGAALLLALAHVLRRGLTVRRAAVVGLVVGFGLLAKPSFFGLIPGAMLGVAFGLWRLRRERPREALRAAAVAIACAAVPLAVYVLLISTVWHRALIPGATEVAGGKAGQAFIPREFFSYLWQFYLPRIPGLMNDQFLSFFPLYEIWLKGLIGRYGWLDTEFPRWVYPLGTAALALVASLGAVELVRRRTVLRERLPEIATYAGLALAFLFMLGLAGFRGRSDVSGFEQARYLLPLLPLYGLMFALAARAAGRHGRALGAALLVVVAAHTVFSQLLLISRFYG